MSRFGSRRGVDALRDSVSLSPFFFDCLHVDGDDWGVEVDDFQPGASYSHTFDEAGVYRYYCSIHGTTEEGMVGAVVVSD